MKKTFQCAIALAALLVGATFARAQVSQPVVVLAIPGYDELVANADFLGALGGQPGVSKVLEGYLKMMTQGQGLKGLDKSKSLGVVLSTENGEFIPTVCIPVTSAKDLVDTLATMQLFTAPPQEDGGATKITLKSYPVDLFIRENNGWAFVTQSKDVSLPGEPIIKAMSGLTSEYCMGARIYLQNVPAETKKAWFAKLRTVMQMMAAQHPADNNPLAALSHSNMQSQVDAIEQRINDADQVTFGWKLDRQAKNMHADATFTVVPGSKLDQEIQQAAKAKSNFAGFQMPDAAITMNLCSINPPEKVEQWVATLDQVKAKMEAAIDTDSNLHNDDAKAQAKKVLGQFADVIQKTVKSGKADSGGVLLLGPDKLQAAVGGFVADGPALETAVKNLVELAKGEPDFAEHVTVKFDLETYKGVRFHQISAKLPPEADDEAKKIFGDTVELNVGVGPESAYAALGKGSLDLVKSVIDHSAATPNQSIPPFQLSIALAPIFKFAAWVHPNDPKSAMMAQAFDSAKGKDHILMGAKLISNGVTYRLDVEDGVLAAIGQASKMAMQPGPRPGAGPRPGGNNFKAAPAEGN